MSDSNITKKAIAVSLKEIMKKKSLEKITVSDIANGCGLNRQTFYYHFKDKYDLLNWIFASEVEAPAAEADGGGDWCAALVAMLGTMKREKAFYISVLNMDRSSVFFDDLFVAVRNMLLQMTGQPESQPLSGFDDDDKLFAADFYAHGLVGMVTQWAKGGMKESPENIVMRLAHLVESENDGSGSPEKRCLKTGES